MWWKASDPFKNFRDHSSSSVGDGLKEEKLMAGKPARPPWQVRGVGAAGQKKS